MLTATLIRAANEAWLDVPAALPFSTLPPESQINRIIQFTALCKLSIDIGYETEWTPPCFYLSLYNRCHDNTQYDDAVRVNNNKIGSFFILLQPEDGHDCV